jgi:hypothetical protein
MPKLKDHKVKDTVKRLSISKEERERFVEGIKTLLMFHSNGVRQRLEVKDNAPKGFKRIIDFDPETYDFLIVDRPMTEEELENAKKAENVEKTNPEAKLPN